MPSMFLERKGQHMEVLFDEGDADSILALRWHIQCRKGSDKYLYARSGCHRYYMHRLVLPAPAGFVVDHINGNTLDNRRCNLRLVTHGQNRMNCSKRVGVSSRFKGVSFSGGRAKPWHPQVRRDGRRVYGKWFATEKEAADAVAPFFATQFHSR